MKRLRCAALALAILPAYAGCAAVLDIEPAKHDPALDKADAGESMCAKYCSTILAACTGTDAQYVPDADDKTRSTICVDVCKRLPVGDPSDVSGNTMGCRMHFAEAAATAASLAGGGEVGELDSDCRAAGPGGNGPGVPGSDAPTCGTNCEALCTLAGPTCESQRGEMTLAQRAILDRDTCAAECAQLPDSNDFNVSEQSGDSVECRLYHVSAAQTNMMYHCPHVGGASPCGFPPGLKIGDGGIHL